MNIRDLSYEEFAELIEEKLGTFGEASPGDEDTSQHDTIAVASNGNSHYGGCGEAIGGFNNLDYIDYYVMNSMGNIEAEAALLKWHMRLGQEVGLYFEYQGIGKLPKDRFSWITDSDIKNHYPLEWHIIRAYPENIGNSYNGTKCFHTHLRYFYDIQYMGVIRHVWRMKKLFPGWSFQKCIALATAALSWNNGRSFANALGSYIPGILRASKSEVKKYYFQEGLDSPPTSSNSNKTYYFSIPKGTSESIRTMTGNGRVSNIACWAATKLPNFNTLETLNSWAEKLDAEPTKENYKEFENYILSFVKDAKPGTETQTV
jgi:hypothetical protein